jgi:hypothetical protein
MVPPNFSKSDCTPWGSAMSDPKFDETRNHRSSFALQSQKLSFLASLCLTLILSTVFGLPTYSRRPYTCAACRTNKTDYQLLGLNWSREEETDCSRWYTENVERSDTHAWIACTYCRRIGIPGLGAGYGCFVGGPLTGLSRTVQISIYQRFEDRLEAKRLFIQLGQTGADTHRMWEALMRWIDRDYPGTWRHWWQQQRATVK